MGASQAGILGIAIRIAIMSERDSSTEIHCPGSSCKLPGHTSASWYDPVHVVFWKRNRMTKLRSKWALHRTDPAL